MRIFFDFEIDAAKSGLDVRLGKDAEYMLEEMRSFFARKLSPFEEEMKKVPTGYVRIAVGEENPITYFYPEELAIKLVDCITEEDYRYIMTKIYFRLHQQ